MNDENVTYPYSFKWSKEIEDFFAEQNIYLLHPFKIRGVYREGETVTIKSPIVVEPFATMSGRNGFSNCGAFTYMHTAFGSRAEVGRYCSIAPYSRLMGNEHPLDRISTHPFACRDYYAAWMEKRFRVATSVPPFEQTDRGPLIVKDDVWIGNGALIRRGITIGHGAVVAAGAIVVKDVPPFAVVGGAPAKVIKYRFDDATIARILDVAWWRYHVRDLAGLDVSDIHGFLDELERRVASGEVKEYSPPRIDIAAALFELARRRDRGAAGMGRERPRAAPETPAARADQREPGQRPAFDAGANARIIDEIMAGGANDFSASDYHGRKGDIARHLIGDEVARRGWHIVSIRKLSYRVVTPDGDIVFQQNAPDVGTGSSRITLDKVATKDLLTRNGIAAPAGRVFTDRDAAAAYFRTCSVAQVVKPAAGAGGDGVTAGVADEPSFVQAWERATAFGRRVIVEDFVAGDEVRMVTVGGKLAAAVCRVPAYVIGDGVRTIEELVAEKNKLRLQNPLLKLYPISSFDQLELDGRRKSEVPGKGERVRLSTVSNIAMGGESVSVIDRLHPSIVAVAEQAARSVPCAILLGLDVLIKDFSASAEDGNVSIIEINSNPAIATLYFAAFGPPASHLPRTLLDFSHQRLREEKGNAPGAPAIVPAAPYRAPCGGGSFRRDYSTQMRLIRQAAYARNLSVHALSNELTVLSNGDRQVAFFQGMSDHTRSISRRATNNKEWTKSLLREAGINTPQGAMFARDAVKAAWEFAQSLGQPVVVKPLSGSGGAGVSTDISTLPHFEQAWDHARAAGSSAIIVEQYCQGKDYRILTVGNTIAAAAERVPAHVVGDGKHTIDGLIAIKNRRRARNPYDGSKPIKLTPMMLRNLAQLGMDGRTVLESGRYLQLHSVANIGSGGESTDLTETVHPDWAEVAVKVRRAVFDPLHVGFDLLAEDISRSPKDQRWVVIEVNANPDMGLHHFVTHGTPRDAAGAIVDALFPRSSGAADEARKSVRIVGSCRGNVKISVHRIWRHAHLRMLDGSIRPLSGRELELVISGAGNAVDDMLSACATGPLLEKSRHSAFHGDIPRGFAVAK